MPVRVTLGALVLHWYTYAPPHCRTSQYSMTFIPLSVSLWNDLANPVFDGVGLTGFKSRANDFYWPKLLYPYYNLLLFSLSLFSIYRLVLWGWVLGLIGCISLSLSLALPTFINNNNNI